MNKQVNSEIAAIIAEQAFEVKNQTHALKCSLSGLVIGSLTVSTVAGHLPYLRHWDDALAKHPVFSLPQTKLLAFARHQWKTVAKSSLDGEASKQQEQLLQVTYLAVLHSLGSVQQNTPALPPLHIVQTTMSKLFALSYWFHALESARFRFPKFKLHTVNSNEQFQNIADYFQICFDIKAGYEKNTDDAVEQHKLKAAERAAKALRSTWIAPVSKKELWRWVTANLTAKYKPDAEGWMKTVFLGNERAVLNFEVEDTDYMIQAIMGDCPKGTGMMKKVEERLNEIRQIQIDNKEAFTVDFDEFFDPDAPIEKLSTVVNGANSSDNQQATVSTEEPKREEYESVSLWIKAKAIWYLRNRAIAQRNSQAGRL
jgi:hypothetical protein